MLTPLALPKVQWFLENSFTGSLKAISDAQYLFGFSQYALSVFNTLINIKHKYDFNMFKYSNCQITHCIDHGGSLTIKCVDTRKYFLQGFSQLVIVLSHKQQVFMLILIIWSYRHILFHRRRSMDQSKEKPKGLNRQASSSQVSTWG